MPKKFKPSSPKKIAANRRNAENSSGPTSAVGKWRSSQNAVDHAFYARSHLLLGESAEERAEHDRVITVNLAPFTACQEIQARQIADVAWIIKRGDRSWAAYINREILIDVMDRKFPPKEIAFTVGGRPIRTAQERHEILAAHKKDLTPTEQDLETTLHRLYGERHDLVSKFEKISLQNRKLLFQMVSSFDRLQKQDRQEQKKANGGYEEPRLYDTNDGGDDTK